MHGGKHTSRVSPRATRNISDAVAGNMTDDEVLAMLREIKASLFAGLRRRAAHARARRKEDPQAVMLSLFNKIDLNQSGAVDINEFNTLLHSIMPGCTEEQLDVLMASIDANDNGLIELKEIQNFLEGNLDDLKVRRHKKRCVRRCTARRGVAS